MHLIERPLDEVFDTRMEVEKKIPQELFRQSKDWLTPSKPRGPSSSG